MPDKAFALRIPLPAGFDSGAWGPVMNQEFASALRKLQGEGLSVPSGHHGVVSSNGKPVALFAGETNLPDDAIVNVLRRVAASVIKRTPKFSSHINFNIDIHHIGPRVSRGCYVDIEDVTLAAN